MGAVKASRDYVPEHQKQVVYVPIQYTHLVETALGEPASGFLKYAAQIAPKSSPNSFIWHENGQKSSQRRLVSKNR